MAVADVLRMAAANASAPSFKYMAREWVCTSLSIAKAPTKCSVLLIVMKKYNEKGSKDERSASPGNNSHSRCPCTGGINTFI